MIFRLALRGMLAHRRRLIGLMSAIALGVAFLTGTLVLGDTMRASFDEVFASANAGTDAVVQGKTIVSGPRGDEQAPVPADLVGELDNVDGVSAAQPVIQGLAQIIGSDGKPLGGNGPPTLAGNWIDNDALNPQRVASGVAPAALDEIVIDNGSAVAGGFALGDRVEVLLPDPVTFTVTGFTKYGDADSLGGSTYVGMTFPAAEKYLAIKGELGSIVLQADEGVTPEELVQRVEPLLPENTEVITGEQLTEQQNQEIQSGFLNFFQIFLTVFAVIALIVSTFSIYNTFSVITAQKSRESALLRAVGASRGQVLGAIAGESLLIGVLAAVIGTGLGIVVAALLVKLFQNLGAVLESASLVVSPSALLTGFIVGIVVTAVASIFPAIRASRVPPLAALRDVAVEHSGRMTVRAVLGGVLILVGIALAASLPFFEGNELLRAGIAAVAAFLGFIIFGPVAARPMARIVGAPIAAARGVSGRMARANAIRNPRRTANTATALMVGVAVVSMFTIFASSIKAAISDNFVGELKAELSLSNNNFSGAGFDPAMVRDLAALPQVAAVSTLDQASALIDGAPTDITVVDVPGIQQVTDLGPVELQPDDIALDSQTAADLGLTSGDTVKFGLPTGRVVVVDIGEQLGQGVPRSSGDLCGRDTGARNLLGVHHVAPRGLGVRRPTSRASGGRPVQCRRGADTGTVRRCRGWSDRPVPGHRLRTSGAGHHHRAHGHREHVVAVGVRAHQRTRTVARRGADPGSVAGHGAMGVGDHRGVRDTGWHRTGDPAGLGSVRRGLDRRRHRRRLGSIPGDTGGDRRDRRLGGGARRLAAGRPGCQAQRAGSHRRGVTPGSESAVRKPRWSLPPRRIPAPPCGPGTHRQSR